MTRQMILMVAHGSPSEAAIAQTETFRDLVAEKYPASVELCYLELNQPDLTFGLRHAAESVGKDGQVIILPLFLGAASHQKNDLPVALQWARQTFPEVNFYTATPFEPHANLIALLDLRLREALASADQPLAAQDSIVLVVGRGSSDPDSNSEVSRAARLLFEKRDYQWAEYAYQAVARPTVEEGARRAILLGAKQLIVAPYLLFTGWVENEILTVAKAAVAESGLRIVFSKPLGAHPLLAEVALQRVEQALNGVASMTCDLCKYRLPMNGYEHQVGQIQHSHHFKGDAH